MTIDKIEDSELFILNDVILRINPTDIQVFDQRYTDSYSAIRYNSTYSVSSTSSLATYVVTHVFDIDNEIDTNDLIKICSQLSKYPFVFIKSQRLDQFVPNINKSINAYSMYAVKEWSLKHSYQAKNAVFLTIELIYFNHTPYVKDYSFLAYESEEDTGSTRGSTTKQKEVSLKAVQNLFESNIFQDYFKADIAEKVKKYNLVKDKIFGSQTTEVIFGSPEIIAANGENSDKPYELIKNNIEWSGFEDQDITLLSYVNTNKTAKNSDESDALNYWLIYKDIPITSVVDGNGNKVFNVQSVTVTRKNNIAVNHLQSYREPFIQYMGKMPAVMNIEMSINNSAFEYSDYQDTNMKPYEIFSTEIKRAENIKMSAGVKFPFKSLRIRSLLNVLSGASYFITDNESTIESSEDQGRQGVSINFIESDITKLIGSNNLNLSSLATIGVDAFPALNIAGELLILYAENNSIKKSDKGGIVSDKIANEVSEKKGYIPKQNIENANLVSQVSNIVKLSNDEKNAILSSGLSSENYVDVIVANVFVATTNYFSSLGIKQTTKETTYLGALIDIGEKLKKLSKASKPGSTSSKIDISSNEFIDMYGMINLSIESLFKRNIKSGIISADISKGKYFEIYTKLLTKAYTTLSTKGLMKDFNEIKGEALPDLDILNSLLRSGNGEDSRYLREGDARKFSPFFFINQNTYIDSEGLMALYSTIEELTKGKLDTSFLFNNDGQTLSDVANYVPQFNEPALFNDTKKETPVKRKRTTTKIKLEALSKNTEIAYQEYLSFVDKNKNNKIYSNSIKSFSITKDFLYGILNTESGGDPNAISENGKHFGLFQLSRDKFSGTKPYTIPFDKWNDPKSNSYAAMEFSHSYIIPGLFSKRATSLKLNPNSIFNFYMMHQQGVDGYLKVVEGYVDPNKRNSRVKERYDPLSGNIPGGSKWDGTYNGFINIWKDHFFKKTGIQAVIFGETIAGSKPSPQMVSARDALPLTKGIGAPPTRLRFTVKKKTEKSFPKLDDGDTLSFDSQYFDIENGEYNGTSLRVIGADTPELYHAGSSNTGQKYSLDALEKAKSIISKMKYPLFVYGTTSTTDNRLAVIIVDSNGSDFTYEMLKNGLAKYTALEQLDLKSRSATYKAIYDSTQSILKLDNDESSRDATRVVAGGAEARTTYDIQDLQKQTTEALGGGNIPKKQDILQRSYELNKQANSELPQEEIRKSEGYLTRDTTPYAKASQINTNGSGIEFREETNAQYRCIRTGNHIANGLDLAVPTIKVYVVEGLRDDSMARYGIAPPRETNLYEVSGIIDAKIQTPDSTNPVSVAVLTVLNPGSIYTDVAEIARRGMSNYYDYEGNNLDPNFASRVGKLRLVTGTRLSIRIGYNNDPNNLENIFNGEIVEVEGEDVLSIVAEGYGRELIAISKSVDDVTEVNGKNPTTNLVIHELLQADEIFSLGLKSLGRNSANPLGRNLLDNPTVDVVDTGVDDTLMKIYRSVYGWLMDDDPNGLWFGDWWSTSSELFTNIYSPVIQKLDNKFSGDIKLLNIISFMEDVNMEFAIYNSTIWDSLKEVSYRHPGTYLNVFNYKERATVFYGIKEQMYIHTDPPLSLFVGSTESFETYNKKINKIKHRLIKPASDMHLITSERDIISNEIKLNASFKTQVDVRYFDSEPSVENLETNSGAKFFSAKLDDNLRPNAIRSKTLYANSCHNPFMAWRYGTCELQNQAEMMYSGRIVIVGNPNMKAGDYAYLSDSFRGLNGIIKIRECSHIISERSGYITVITPGAFIEPRIYRYSNLYTKLGLAWTIAANSVKTDANSALFDTRKIKYTTSFMEVLSNKELARQLYSSALSSGSYGAISKTLGLYGSVLGLSGAALYKSFPFIVSSVARVSAAIISSSAGGSIVATGTAGLSLAKGALISKAAYGNGILSTISRLTLAVINGVSAGISRGVSIAAMIAGSPLLFYGGVIVIASGILALYLSQTLDGINQTRQPLVMYPLLNNGIPYQAGLFGYEINTYGESFSKEFSKTMEDIKDISKAARSRFFTAAGSESELAQTIAVENYFNALNRTSSPNIFYRNQKEK